MVDRSEDDFLSRLNGAPTSALIKKLAMPNLSPPISAKSFYAGFADFAGAVKARYRRVWAAVTFVHLDNAIKRETRLR